MVGSAEKPVSAFMLFLSASWLPWCEHSVLPLSPYNDGLKPLNYAFFL
jgi:hypothetical protein